MREHDTFVADPQWWKKNYLSRDYIDSHTGRKGEPIRKEVAFITSVIPLVQSEPIVDLACAEGGHLQLMAQAGFRRLIGVDLSPFMIERAINQTPPEIADRIEFVCSDIRSVGSLTKNAQLIQILYNSIGFFDDEQDHLKLFVEIRNSLRDGGAFFLDFFPASYLIKNIRQNVVDASEDKETTVDEYYDHTKRRLVRRTSIRRLTKSDDISTRVSSQRIFEIEDMTELLSKAGFRQQLLYSDYEFAPYNSRTSAKACVVAIA